MNVIHKPKSQVRAETNDQVEKFLRSGGVIEVVKSRKAPKQLMSGKTTRSSSTGTSGFAVGFPKRTMGA
jgi:hypothetical protein